MVLVALVTVIGLATHGLIDPTNLVMLFLLVVVIVALRFGLGPAIFTALASLVAFDFFIVPPRLTFEVADTQYLLTFVGLLITGIVISTLAARARQRADEAVERAQLLEQAREAELLRATEKLQTALLNSISHDLRTPLASITGAVSTLRDPEVQLDPSTRAELIADIATEADRLNRLVGNLLDMTPRRGRRPSRHTRHGRHRRGHRRGARTTRGAAEATAADAACPARSAPRCP